jgi:diguanylate cyclase (GGDEF)-like protein/hemerythrin-like metal-binding protein
MVIDGRPILQATVRDISKQKENEERIGFMANHDRLTELPNRELFYDRLSQAISQARRRNEGIALLFLDLDGFKPVNDSYGHEAGDVVLKVVAKRLQECVRDMDTVARMGGDEFAIISNSVKSRIDAEVVAQKILDSVAEGIQINAIHSCAIGVSIGISIYPDNGAEIDILMSVADAAMYESKAAGKNTYTISELKNAHYGSGEPWIRPDEIPMLGLQIMDDQHMKIVGMLNMLNEAIKHKKSAEQLLQLLNELISFTEYHFGTEEQLMREYSYPEEVEHHNVHEHLLHEINYLKERFAQGGELVLLQRLKDWFSLHIVSSDKALAKFIQRT